MADLLIGVPAGAYPIFSGDLYGRDGVPEPYDAYRRIRDLGPAVWMPKRRLWAIGRFDDVRAALRAQDRLVSGKGVAANALANGRNPPITLTSDGDTHRRRRHVLIQPISPRQLGDLRRRLEEEADTLVASLTKAGTFDAMARFASYLPLKVVADLVGLRDAARRSMLRWASATFDVLGVMNWRGLKSLPHVLELGRYARRIDRSNVVPGGWADRLLDAAERGELCKDEAKAMIIDYVGPSLDTTILATGHMVWWLANTPGAYEAVRADPSLIPSAVNEAVRIGSPLRAFTRYAAEDYDVDGVTIPKGARALVLFASANRDERHYPSPDCFDVRRNPRDQVGWGHGAHTCVGMHLSRLEMEILCATLVRHVANIETDAPTHIHHNVLQGYATLPTRFVAA